MCSADLRMVDENGLPRLLHLTITPAELDYLRIGINGNMISAAGGFLTAIMHRGEITEFAEEHDIKQIHNDLNLKFAPLLGLKLCPKCDEFHRPDCEGHNEECDGLKGATL